MTNTSNTTMGREITFELNDWQMEVAQVWANIMYLFIGRGGGKTVGAISPWMVRVAEAMPGHLSGIFGQTFEHLDNNIMPKIFLGFIQLGYQKEVDYVVGVKPPDHWPKCLYPLKKYEKTITWRNGTTWQQVSLHTKGSANAFDFQSGIFDEAKYMNEGQLVDEVFPTFRGFDHLFGHQSEYQAKIFATDKLLDYVKIKWLLDKRDQVDKGIVQQVIDLQNKVNQLEAACEMATTSQQNRLHVAIRRLNYRLTTLRKNMVYVAEASARSNIKNLGASWWADKKREMSAYEFNVAIENKDPIQSKEGFYPNLSEANLYKELYPQYDCISTQGLIITMDYQHSIAPMCVAQLGKLPGRNVVTLNYINEFYALYPAGLEQTVDLFCDYYKHHANKVVSYVFDQTAIGKRPTADPVYTIVIARFKKNGWIVREVYTADTPTQYDKYQKINQRLAEPGNSYQVMINTDRCPWTITSMRAANTMVASGETRKDKEYENTKRHPNVDQRATTHFSDTFDQLEWAVNELHFVKHQVDAGSAGAGFR